MRLKKILSLLILSVLALSLMSCGKNKNIRFGTDNKNGVYNTYAGSLMEHAKQDGLSDATVIKETAGSYENLTLMRDGLLDIAIVEDDALYNAASGKGKFADNPYTGARVVANLYTEPCQIVVSKASKIKSVSDLNGKRISVGVEESGAENIAEEILKSAGIDESMIEKYNYTPADAAKAMREDRIDAFFVVSAFPDTIIDDLSKEMDINVLSLDDDTIEYMMNLYPGYQAIVIPSWTYENQESVVITIGAKAVLVADEKFDSKKVNILTEAIFNHSSEINTELGEGSCPDMAFATDNIEGTLHEGAKMYYDSKCLSQKTDEQTGQIIYTFE